ncbi:MAG: hypothetical protein AAGA48_38080 [Myxococcota bacterium]
MTTHAMVGFTPPGHLDLVVEGFDEAVMGKEVEIEVVHMATVQDSRPVHGREVLWSTRLTLDSPDLMLPIDLPAHVAYAYHGVQVSLTLEVRVFVPHGGWFWSHKTLAEATVDLPQWSHAEGSDTGLMDPYDHYDLSRAFESLGPAARRRVIQWIGGYSGGLLLGLVGAVWSGWVAVVLGWLVLVVLGGYFVYRKVWQELSGYIDLQWGFVPPLGPDVVVPVHGLLDGRPRIDLVQPRLRIVACNLEKGQYKRGSGTDVRTVSFSEPVGATILFDQTVEHWPAGMALAERFPGEVDFGPAFERLAPPMQVGEEHGVGIRWEAQLIVPELVDLEVEGPEEVWMWPEHWSPS